MFEVGVNWIASHAVPLLLALACVGWCLRRRSQVLVILSRGVRLPAAITVGITALAASAFGFWQVEFSAPESQLLELDRYFTRALTLVEHGVFGYGQTPTAFFPPGYSFLLGPAALLMGDTKWAWFTTNCLILILATLVFAWQLRRLSVPISTATVFSLLLLLNPNRLVSLHLPMSDVPFALIFVVMLGFLVLATKSPDRPGDVFAAAVLGGVGILVRVSGALFLVPVVVWLLIRRGPAWAAKVRMALIFAVVCLAVVLPWTIRNWALYGKLVPVSTNGGYNLLIGSDPRSTGGWNPYAEHLRRSVRDLSETDQDDVFVAQALRNIRDHPLRFTLLGVWKIVRSFADDTYALVALWRHSNAASVSRLTTNVVFGLSNFAYYLLVVASAAVLWRRRGEEPEVTGLVAATLVGVAVVLFVWFGLTRYKEPANTVLLLLLAVHAGSALRSAEAGKRSERDCP